MSALRHRHVAGAALAVLLLLPAAGCGGSDDKPKATPQGPADRTQRTDAGARAALREYAIAFTSSDGEKLCDLLDPTSQAMASATKARCRREAARLKSVLSAADRKRFRQNALTLRPVVKGNEATLPGSSEPALRYIDGRWYVVPVPAEDSSPPS